MQAEPRPAARPVATDLAQPAGRARHFLRVVGAIVWKDLAAELRSRELLSAMIVFALLVILTFNFALELDRSPAARERTGAGVLWVATVFTGTLGLNRSLAMEKDRGSLDGMLLAPIDRSALYLGKALGNLLFILLVEAILLPVLAILFNLPMLRPLLLGVVGLGAVGYAAVGTLLASLAMHSRSRDVMLPILLLPVAVPVLVAAVRATSGVLAASAWDEIAPWINLLIGYDVIFIAAAFMLFEYVVEE
ncbi:MAG: heme exporter protein CcmB [Anaerolineales bacterium]|nr:heme exporter protein CcmB [Anaerolineales bacterium]